MSDLGELRFIAQTIRRQFAAKEAARQRDRPYDRAIESAIAQMHAKDPFAATRGCNHFYPQGQFNCSECGKSALTSYP